MTSTTALAALLAHAGVVDETLDADAAARLATLLGLDPVTTEEFMTVLAVLAQQDEEDTTDGEFELRVGRWQLDLAREVTRSAVMAAVLGAVYVSTEVDAIGVALVAAIVPALVDLEDVSLSAGDEQLLIEVRRIPEVTDRLVGIDELYAQLPDHVQSRLNPWDFANFLERLRDAGVAVSDEDGDRLRVRRAGEKVPRIRWR